jgi:hypothetical protein
VVFCTSPSRYSGAFLNSTCAVHTHVGLRCTEYDADEETRCTRPQQSLLLTCYRLTRKKKQRLHNWAVKTQAEEERQGPKRNGGEVSCYAMKGPEEVALCSPSHVCCPTVLNPKDLTYNSACILSVTLNTVVVGSSHFVVQHGLGRLHSLLGIKVRPPMVRWGLPSVFIQPVL